MTHSPVTHRADRGLLKSKILEAGIRHHRKSIADSRQRLSDIMALATNNVGEYESHQKSFKPETMAEVSLLSDQLGFVINELDQLMHIQPYYDEAHLCAEYGTVVKTDKDTFFISAGTERFNVDDFSVYSLSVYSPLYLAMKGKKVGDLFTHEGTTYTVEEIF